jgi:4-diphosphocytidyl-2-C-methyl-D-erythritol kinase
MTAPSGTGPVDELRAPAKLTLSLRITGVRPDGYHLLESEMVTVDLGDTLVLEEGDHLTVATGEGPYGRSGAVGWPPRPIPTGPDNLIRRALAVTGRTAAVRLVKRVPPGAGLGGGSADAAAILRWAGRTDPALAVTLGADVPFCLRGGRALVRGVGEELEPLPHEDRSFVLLLLPFGVDTAAAYRAWDELVERGEIDPPWPGSPARGDTEANDLEAAALVVEPRLGPWRSLLGEVSGRRARMAGSGSTLFVEGTPESCGLEGRATLALGDQTGLLVPVRTTPPIR